MGFQGKERYICSQFHANLGMLKVKVKVEFGLPRKGKVHLFPISNFMQISHSRSLTRYITTLTLILHFFELDLYNKYDELLLHIYIYKYIDTLYRNNGYRLCVIWCSAYHCLSSFLDALASLDFTLVSE